MDFIKIFYHFQEGPTPKIIDRSTFFKVANSGNQKGLKYIFPNVIKITSWREIRDKVIYDDID